MIFRWYERDFGGTRGVIDFIFDYIDDEKTQAFLRKDGNNIKFEYLHYDWNLNR